MKVNIIRWEITETAPARNGIVSVIESEDTANLVFDLLDKHGDKSKVFTIDTFEVVQE